mmetsp:Transcript_735/g.2124  ORF Transcript_735/g.2124 Transcript_735/m.2124 type:complete len:128 (-) Transcript_735:10-393(-)
MPTGLLAPPPVWSSQWPTQMQLLAGLGELRLWGHSSRLMPVRWLPEEVRHVSVQKILSRASRLDLRGLLGPLKRLDLPYLLGVTPQEVLWRPIGAMILDFPRPHAPKQPELTCLLPAPVRWDPLRLL